MDKASKKCCMKFSKSEKNIKKQLAENSGNPVINIRSRDLTPEEIFEFPDLNKSCRYEEIIVCDNSIVFDQQFANHLL